MSAPASALTLSERPLHKKLHAELKLIAAAMDLPADLKRDPLLRSIQQQMKKVPQLADDSRFTPLFGHRTPLAAGGKTSADKAVEEDIESGKVQKAPTGALKELLLKDVKTDPPAQFAKLGGGGRLKSGDSSAANGGGADDNSESSDSEEVVRSENNTPEPEITPEDVAKKQTYSADVQVNFLDERNHATTIRQVVVDKFPVVLSTAGDGTRKYSTLLSELIPAAIHNDSPIKERSGRMYRSNIRNDPQHHHIGKIDALLAGTASALRSNQMNEYTLRSSDGSLFCDIWWEQPLEDTGSAVPGAVEPKLPAVPKFTGAASDVPLDIANSRAANDPMHKNADPALRTTFAEWVHGVIKAAIPDIPGWKESWVRCTFAGQMLDRHLKQEAVFEFLADSKWSGTRGGYVVPKGLTYAGVAFKKEFLLEEILNIRPSSTSEIDSYFLPRHPRERAEGESMGGE
ncbi:hypothetical protein MVEN_02349500 [Mycena venus]|uniref:Uncharacterized protein n=1 Tax=Mycena venus TaxID=2733690 RepID=A0A8H7CET4_9AGAR|nr:hypothetical protein MVEN_02349500 [Mycena venus]